MAPRIAAILMLACAALAQTNLPQPVNILPAAAGSATGELRLRELYANGSNYVGFKAPTSISANVIWTLPSADSSGCLNSNGSGALSIAPCASSWISATSDGADSHTSTFYNALIAGPSFVMRRSRGTAASPADVSAGDVLGILSWQARASGAFGNAAKIEARAESISGANTSGELRAYVYDSLAASVEKIRVTNSLTKVFGNFEVTGTCTGCGSGFYNQVREENVNVTQRDVLNFVGSALTASDSGTRTDITLSQSPSGSASVVGTGRAISTSAPLSGGGDLSADRTLSCPTCVATNVANTFTEIQTISGTWSSGTQATAQLNFNDSLAPKIKLYTGYTISIAASTLRIARDFSTSKISFGHGAYSAYTEDAFISNGYLNIGGLRITGYDPITIGKSLAPETGNSYDLGYIPLGIGWRDLLLDRHAYIEGNIEHSGSYLKSSGQLRIATTSDTTWTPSGNTLAKIAIYNTSGTFIGWVPIYP